MFLNERELHEHIGATIIRRFADIGITIDAKAMTCDDDESQPLYAFQDVEHFLSDLNVAQ
jgi:hypothetical protein